jgi:hypothetical protein
MSYSPQKGNVDQPNANAPKEPFLKGQSIPPTTTETKNNVDKPASEKFATSAAVEPPKRSKRVVVDEMHEKAVTVGFSTVIFRPNQHLDSEHMIQLAKANNIAVREV